MLDVKSPSRLIARASDSQACPLVGTVFSNSRTFWTSRDTLLIANQYCQFNAEYWERGFRCHAWLFWRRINSRRQGEMAPSQTTATSSECVVIHHHDRRCIHKEGAGALPFHIHHQVSHQSVLRLVSSQISIQFCLFFPTKWLHEPFSELNGPQPLPLVF